MTRHFGLTSRSDLGAQHRSGSRTDADTRANPSILLPAGSTLELGEIGESPFDEREISSGALFFAVPLFSILFVLSVVVGYAALVSQPIEYQVGVHRQR